MPFAVVGRGSAARSRSRFWHVVVMRATQRASGAGRPSSGCPVAARPSSALTVEMLAVGDGAPRSKTFAKRPLKKTIATAATASIGTNFIGGLGAVIGARRAREHHPSSAHEVTDG